MTERLTWDQVRAWRLARQRLIERGPVLEPVISEVCGFHAQVTSSAELHAWARVEGVRPQDVRDALWVRRSLVRTWCMRGTLHLLAAADLPLYVAALRTQSRWFRGAWLRWVGLTADELRELAQATHDALSDVPLTREQLAAKVAERIGLRARDHLLSGWGMMLKPAAFQGSLISGPPRGQSVTFVRPQSWLETWEEPSVELAWREIVRRYLRVYGPANHRDFGIWWGMQAGPAGKVLKASAGELVEVDVEGYRGWLNAEDLPELRKTPPTTPTRLLPAFDVYTIGNRQRVSLVEEAFADRVFRQAGWISPVVVARGLIVGVWSHRLNGGRLEVRVQPFRPLTAGQKKEIAREARRLGEFLEAPAAVSYS